MVLTALELQSYGIVNSMNSLNLYFDHEYTITPSRGAMAMVAPNLSFLLKYD